jgi:pantetheine-phosphate adenylyltransferase
MSNSKQNRTIVYPGTFDPITLGHSNLVERAARLFDKVVVAIADSKKKQPMFDLEERKQLCQQALSHVPNIEVISFRGLIVDLVHEQNAIAVLRGVRSMTDFDYELQMAGMNSAMYPDFETVFLTPDNKLSFISSTLVREISNMQGDVAQFVHPAVHNALKSKRA